jgi:hypothetical protein
MAVRVRRTTHARCVVTQIVRALNSISVPGNIDVSPQYILLMKVIYFSLQRN